jgi:hypothetical protein
MQRQLTDAPQQPSSGKQALGGDLSGDAYVGHYVLVRGVLVFTDKHCVYCSKESHSPSPRLPHKPSDVETPEGGAPVQDGGGSPSPPAQRLSDGAGNTPRPSPKEVGRRERVVAKELALEGDDGDAKTQKYG